MGKKERIDKIISNMGYGSRKDVKGLIKEGAVELDGKLLKDNKIKVDPYEARIVVNGELLSYREFIYLMMNKPQGYVSSTEDYVSYTVLELLSDEELIFEPFPAGRLDKDTEGLLFLTNDGQLAHNMTSPKKEVPKTYYARVDGLVEDRHIDEFKEGVTLDDGYHTKPGHLKILSQSEGQSEIELTITEGKFHQVKRMFNSIGMEVVYLKRLSIANLVLDQELELGDYRELTDEELKALVEYLNL